MFGVGVEVILLIGTNHHVDVIGVGSVGFVAYVHAELRSGLHVDVYAACAPLRGSLLAGRCFRRINSLVGRHSFIDVFYIFLIKIIVHVGALTECIVPGALDCTRFDFGIMEPYDLDTAKT